MRAVCRVGFLSLSVGVIAVSTSMLHAADPNEFQVVNYDRYDDGTVDLPGRLFVPTDYDPSQSYPLVVFHHGAGERGNNNTNQVNSNIDNLLTAAKNRDFFIYAPQAPSGGWWNLGTVDLAMKVVPRIANTYSIDRGRMYVTGLSMGGEGVWNNYSNYEGVFAAAVPICGTTNIPNGDTKVANMVGKPIWAYHAVNDGTVNVSRTRNMVNAIRAADGGMPPVSFPLNNDGSPYYLPWQNVSLYEENNLRYSEYGGGDHWIWGNVYNEQHMYDWMLGKSLTPTSPQQGEKVLIDFGPTSQSSVDSQGRRWNSTAFGTDRTSDAAIAFARTSDGRQTPVNIIVSDTFGNGSVTTGPTSGGAFDSNITSDAWYTGSWSGNAAAQNEKGAVIIEGLDPDTAYRLELFASVLDDDSGNGRITRYTVGSLYRDLNVAFNLTNLAIFESIFPDTYGTITLTVSAAPGTTSRFGHLGAMTITAVPEPAMLSLLAFGTLQLSMRRRRSAFPA